MMHGYTNIKLTTAYLVAKLRSRFTAGFEGATLPTAVATEFVPNCVLPCFVNRTECTDIFILKNEVRLHKHCGGKAISITHSECVYVALVIQHAKCMRRIILSSVACPAAQCIFTLPHKNHDFRK